MPMAIEDEKRPMPRGPELFELAGQVPFERIAPEQADGGAVMDSELVLAALMETDGVTDQLASSYGAESVFDLAETLLANRAMRARVSTSEGMRRPRKVISERLWTNLARGPLVLVSMGVMLF